jgi:sugar (pentulose or hexulose) kinase
VTSILAVDQGTTATKALLLSAKGEVEGFARSRVPPSSSGCSAKTAAFPGAA